MKKRSIVNVAVLVLLIAISDIIIFWPYISGELLYVFKGWGYDTFHTYVPVMKFFSQMINEDRLGLMSLQMGTGGDVFGYQIWMSNPIACVIYVIMYFLHSNSYIGVLAILFPLLTSLFGGIVCYFYLKNYNISNNSIILASYMYALCGYLISTGSHYFFVTNLIAFPVLLISVDRVLYKNKAISFLWAVFFVAVQGPYTAFPMFIATAVYIVYKFIFVIREKVAIKWLKILVSGCTGLLMSAFVLVPSSYHILGVSGRVDVSESLIDKYFSIYPVFIDKKTLITALARLFSNNLQGGVDQYTGMQVWFSDFPYYFSILFLFLVFQYVAKLLKNIRDKGNTRLLFTFFLFILVFVTNIVPGLLNLFSYNSWRMIYVVLPFFALLSGSVIDDIVYKKEYSVFANVLCTVLSLACLVLFYINNYITNIYSFIISIIFVLVFAIVLELFRIVHHRDIIPLKKASWIILLFALVLNYVIEHHYSVSVNITPIKYSRDDEHYVDGELQQCIDSIDKDVFTRIERTFLGTGPDANWSLTMPCRTVSTYNSTLDQGVKNYITNMVNFGAKEYQYIQMIYAPNSVGDYGIEFDETRAAVLGIKYVVTNRERQLSDWELVHKTPNYYMYENKTLEAGGLLYDSWITEQQYETLSMAEKVAVESQCVVISDDSLINSATSKIDLEYNKECFAEYSIEPGAEIIIDVSKYDLFSEKERTALQMTMEVDQISQVIIGRSLDGIDYVSDDYYVSENNKEICQILEEDCKYISVKNNGNEIITMVSQMVRAPIKYNGNIQLTNRNMSDLVEGKVTISDEFQMLFLPITYMKGWQAFIDGVQTEIYNANYGFIAIKVPKGEHYIELRYHNTLFENTFFVSAVTLLLVLAYMILDIYKKKKVLVKQ